MLSKLNWEKSKLTKNCPIWTVLDKHQNLIARIEFVPSSSIWSIQILNHTVYHKGSVHQKQEIKKLAEILFERRLTYLSSLILDELKETNEVYENDCLYGQYKRNTTTN